MGIYTRDQIQYANMLQNAIQNRARAIEREGDNIRGRGQMWGSALNTAGNTIKDAAFSIASYQHGDQEAQKQRDFQAEQAALRNKEAMDRLAREQEFQAQQNELNRQNTINIAKENKANVDAGRIDEYQKGYNNASSQWSIAMEDLKKDPNNTTAKAVVAKWQNEMDYYGKKLGMDVDAMKAERILAQFEQPTVGTPIGTPISGQPISGQQISGQPISGQPIRGQTVAENQRSFDEIMKGKWNNATKAKAIAKAMSNTDPSAQEVQLQATKNKGLTSEEKKAGWNKDVAEWDGTGKEPEGTRSKIKGNKIQLIDIKTGKVLKEI